MRAFLLILSLVGVALLGWYGGNSQRATDATDADASQAVAESPTISEVSADQTASTIRCPGKLVPRSGLIQIVAPVGSQIFKLTEKSIGQEVLQDEVLATLQGRQVREKELKLAKARRADAIKQARLKKEQAQFKLSSAQLAVEEAAAADEKISVEEQKIGLLERQLATNQSLLARLQQIKADPTTARLLNETDVEKQELMVDQLELQIEQAELTVKQARKSAARAMTVAKNNLKAVEKGLADADQLVPTSSLDAAVELATVAWEMTELKSPIPTATILDIIVREGDSVTNKPVMVIGDTSEMHCVAEVSDQFLRQIDLDKHQNLRAKITSSAVSAPLLGTVVRKGVMIGAPSLTDPNPFAKVDRRTGNVTILLDDPSAAAKLVNLQVEVEIEVKPGTF